MATSLPERVEAGAGDATSWLTGVPVQPPSGELGPVQLAWLGDAVWELHQRLQRCRRPARSQTLHQEVVQAVRADAQAKALECLDSVLNEVERDLVRLSLIHI